MSEPRYNLSYVLSARKFCVYDTKMKKRYSGNIGSKEAQEMVTVLNAAEQAFNERENERNAERSTE